MKTLYGKGLGLFALVLFFSVMLISWPFTPANAFPPPKIKTAVVFSQQVAPMTIFFARISGPSPQDVASFTAVGPSGTYNLTPRISFRELGLYYAVGDPAIIANGLYTFRLTDTAGRTATVVREFTYDGTLPQVNASTMIPANQAYVGTTTPTLSFDAVPGAVYYSVQLRDLDDKAIWYSSPTTTTTSFPVPSGLLQPNTAYKWAARIWDRAENPQNLHESEWFTFYIGTKADPELTSMGVMSLPVGTSWQYLLNLAWANCVNVAPWDYQYITATGPDSTSFNLNDPANSAGYNFQAPTNQGGQLYLDPPTESVPDGVYTFEVADKSGHKATKTQLYAYNPVPDFSSESRIPEDNAYFDTDTPTFSWARITGDTGDGSYVYAIRIVDYSTGIRWYDSPLSADTSFRLPDDLNLPKGSSYKWRVNVYGPAGSGGTSRNNYRMSTFRTFTINGPARFVNKNDATCGGKSPCYTSIQAAIDAAETGDDIRIAGGIYPEGITLNQDKDLRQLGGWDASFENQNGATTLRQAPKAPQGSLTLQELTIKPE